MQIIVDDLATHYQRSGSGKKILLLHGWADSLGTFDDIVQGLEDNYELIRLDLPGFGKTDLPKETWGLEDYSQFVANFLAKIEAQDIHILIGHSNGGATAIYANAEGLVGCDKLILIGASGVRTKDTVKKNSIKAVTKVGKLTTKVLPKKTQNKIKKKVYNSVGSDLYSNEDLEETFKKVVTQDLQDHAKKINVPTLLVYGYSDSATPVEYGELYSSLIPDSKLVIIDDAGHNVHKHQPDRVLSQIKEFL